MTDKYFIVDIIEAEDSKYGDVFIIKANPVESTRQGYMRASESRVSAEQFFMPLDNYLIQSIIAEQRKNRFWSVNPNDFDDEFIFDESTNQRRLIHRHFSFHEMDIDTEDEYDEESDDNLFEILNIDKKCESIRDEWIKQGNIDISSLKYYIIEKATEGKIGKFWAWLLDDESLLEIGEEDFEYLDIDDKYSDTLAYFITYCILNEQKQ